MSGLSSLPFQMRQITSPSSAALQGIGSVEACVFGALARHLEFPEDVSQYCRASTVSPNIQKYALTDPTIWNDVRSYVDKIQKTRGKSLSVEGIDQILDSLNAVQRGVEARELNKLVLQMDPESFAYNLKRQDVDYGALPEPNVYFLSARDFRDNALIGTFTQMGLKPLVIGRKIFIGDRESLKTRAQIDEVYRLLVGAIGQLKIHGMSTAEEAHLAVFHLPLSKGSNENSSVNIEIQPDMLVGGLEVLYRLEPTHTGFYAMAQDAISKSIDLIKEALR